MSYLDVPRIQFAGLFFTNPDTMNNYIRSYNLDTQLENAQGQYLSDPADGGPGGWNAMGVAQLWIEDCKVLSAVDPSGSPVIGDSILGAAVETPSPKTPKRNPSGGFYDIAKMVDLDPDVQFRSGIYGLRFHVTLENGAGFSGLLSVPELQYMAGRVPVRTGSWSAVGTWMGQIADVNWHGDVESSPLLVSFRQACSLGISVKLTVDLHQNNPRSRLVSGNEFCYGRVLGSMGPIKNEGELPQIVPGRMLLRPPQAPTLTAAVEARAAHDLSDYAPQTIDERFRGDAVEPQEVATAVAVRGDTELAPWNAVPALVSTVEGGGTFLHADLGGAIQLEHTFDKKNEIFDSNGKFLVDSEIRIGWLEERVFQPLAHGEVNFANQYVPLDSNKRLNLVTSAGLVDVPLELHEVAKVRGNSLAISVGGRIVLKEPADGVLLGATPYSVRLEPGGTATVHFMARRLGEPIVDAEPVNFQAAIVRHEWSANKGAFESSLQASNDITVHFESPTDKDGIAKLIVTATAGQVTLDPARKPLDSTSYYVFFVGEGNRLVNDGSPNISVLLYQPYVPPSTPTWDRDVGPILRAYARLYPGMKERLDIGDEATAKGFAPILYQRMSAPFNDPGYMPVTRDLAPAKVKMILDWARTILGPRPPRSDSVT